MIRIEWVCVIHPPPPYRNCPKLPLRFFREREAGAICFLRISFSVYSLNHWWFIKCTSKEAINGFFLLWRRVATSFPRSSRSRQKSGKKIWRKTSTRALIHIWVNFTFQQLTSNTGTKGGTITKDGETFVFSHCWSLAVASRMIKLEPYFCTD